MASIAIKRLYEKDASSDGMRILVDRLWPRGVSNDAAALDLWCKEIAPTPELRSNPAVPEIVSGIGKRNATLLYAAHDETVNHAVILADYLRGYRPRPSASAATKTAKKATARRTA
jgi:uncharacterized protein YeaO (DUF488 family)